MGEPWSDIDKRGYRQTRRECAYVSLTLGLTLLVPDIIEAILDRRQPAELQLRNLLAGFPLEWKR